MRRRLLPLLATPVLALNNPSTNPVHSSGSGSASPFSLENAAAHQLDPHGFYERNSIHCGPFVALSGIVHPDVCHLFGLVPSESPLTITSRQRFVAAGSKLSLTAYSCNVISDSTDPTVHRPTSARKSPNPSSHAEGDEWTLCRQPSCPVGKPLLLTFDGGMLDNDGVDLSVVPDGLGTAIPANTQYFGLYWKNANLWNPIAAGAPFVGGNSEFGTLAVSPPNVVTNFGHDVSASTVEFESTGNMAVISLYVCVVESYGEPVTLTFTGLDAEQRISGSLVVTVAGGCRDKILVKLDSSFTEITCFRVEACSDHGYPGRVPLFAMDNISLCSKWIYPQQ